MQDFTEICYKTISFKTGQQALHLEPGDIIELSYHNVFKDEPFRITEIRENNDGTFEISARSYNKNIYNDYLGSTIQVYDYSTKPTSLTGVVPEIKNLELNQQSRYWLLIIFYFLEEHKSESDLLLYQVPPDFGYLFFLQILLLF